MSDTTNFCPNCEALAKQRDALLAALEDAKKGIDDYWAKCRPQVMKRIDAAIAAAGPEAT